MKIARYVLLGPLAIVLIVVGCLPFCTYLRMLGCALLGKGKIG